jgi:uncharacterized heparinase superfamily protein
MTEANSFCFLNEAGALTDGWDNPEQAKLWRYNLHYFDDLNAANAEERQSWHAALIERWVAENPPGCGTGWEPYPVSLRIVNWVKWAMAGNRLSSAAADSLAVQARWLMRRLEWHILGNHLFANAKALIFAGLYFDGAEAERWLSKGINILLAQLEEQILLDGGQFELSPMYHALALEDVLDLINISNTSVDAGQGLRAACATRVSPMLLWLRTMCHPDGEIAFFNDAAIGIAPPPAEIEAYANRLGFLGQTTDLGSRFLEQSGYARLEGDSAVLIADVAKVGPDYLPGHGHADTLSFELSLAGRRMIVNAGTSVYGTGEDRLRERGTPAHNSVTIDDLNSSEIWSGFRVGRRAKPYIEHFSDHRLSAWHDGYRNLSGKPLHHRHWSMEGRELLVIDEIVGKGRHEIKLHFHFAPWITLEQAEDPSTIILEDMESNQICRITVLPAMAIKLAASNWHPEFGLSIPCRALTLAWHGELPFRHETSLCWSD